MAQRTKLFPKVCALLSESAAKFRAAPIAVENFEYRDSFTKDHAIVSVEYVYGKWCTIFRMYAGVGDGSWKQHESREAARTFARTYLESFDR